MGTNNKYLYVLIKWLPVWLPVMAMAVVLAFAYISWKDYSVNKQPEGATVVRVFKSSGARLDRLEVHGWAVLGEPPETREAAVRYLNTRAKKLFPEGEIPLIKDHYGNRNLTLHMEGRLKSGVYAKASLLQDTGASPKRERAAYLVVSLFADNPLIANGESITDDALYPYLDLDKLVLRVMEGESFTKSTVASGIIDGQMSPRQVNELIQKMLRKAHAQKVEVLEDERLVSVSAYTPDVRQQLTSGGKSVNINMALRYNSLENKTHVYVGSPLITSEY